VYYDRILGDIFRRNLGPKEGDYFAGLLEEHRFLCCGQNRNGFAAI
jgi:hypothetical protein